MLRNRAQRDEPTTRIEGLRALRAIRLFWIELI